MDRVRLRVAGISAETPLIRRIVFDPALAGERAWEAGAHVRVSLPAGGDRPYSLMALPELAPGQWAIGVLLDEKGAGGSRFMHSLKVGDEVRTTLPVNNFPLHKDETPSVLMAGGIGITPILSMAAELKARGAPFTAHYAGRNQQSLAFLSPMRAICGDALAVHYDSDESRLDIGKALEGAGPSAHVYVCGPAGMMEAVKTIALAKGYPMERLHSELFAAAAPASGHTAFEVEIASSGQVLTVAPEQTIIEALEAAGLEPLYDCRRGDCGICQCGVVAGVPDHRDVILTDEEKRSNKVMQICVSRAKSPRLVLDL